MKKACTKEQIQERKKEILNVLSNMFDTIDYKEITMKTISDKISIARSSLYCYYPSKEEMMLDLFKNDYNSFIKEIILSIKENNDLASSLTKIYLSHMKSLKIISLYLVEIEAHTSFSSLVNFKRECNQLINELKETVDKTFQNTPKEKRQIFINSLLMLMHGLYPLINPYQKQVEAMKEVGMSLCTNQYEFCYSYLNYIIEALKK